jgi:hypothetical protein
VAIEGIEPTDTIQEELDRLLTQLELEDYLSMASQAMEIYEMFDKAGAIGSNYGQGYQDGFWAGRQLDAKYQLAKMKSFKEKNLDFIERSGY